ncbi:MAG: cache domain-containing protein [Deltaproteobacteria bacterium]|jgi:two-component system NtrC family sensor kinase
MKTAKVGNIFRKSPARNMVLIFVIISFTPMILVSAIILNQFDRSYHEKVHDHLRELVQKHQQNIDNFLKERLGNIQLLAESSSFEELSHPAFLKHSLGGLQTHYGNVFEDLGVIDEQGRHVAYVGPYDLLDKNYKETFWFKKVMETECYVSDVFPGFRKRPHFIMAVKRSMQQGRPWILRATIDFDAFNRVVEGVRIGETGLAFILNREGEFQTEPRLDVSSRIAVYRDLFKQAKENDDPVQIFEGEDVSGQENIVAATFLKNGDWLLVYQQSLSDAFKVLNRTEKKAVMVLLAVGFCTLMISIVLSVVVIKGISRDPQGSSRG